MYFKFKFRLFIFLSWCQTSEICIDIFSLILHSLGHFLPANTRISVNLKSIRDTGWKPYCRMFEIFWKKKKHTIFLLKLFPVSCLLNLCDLIRFNFLSFCYRSLFAWGYWRSSIIVISSLKRSCFHMIALTKKMWLPVEKGPILLMHWSSFLWSIVYMIWLMLKDKKE